MQLFLHKIFTSGADRLKEGVRDQSNDIDSSAKGISDIADLAAMRAIITIAQINMTESEETEWKTILGHRPFDLDLFYTGKHLCVTKCKDNSEFAQRFDHSDKVRIFFNEMDDFCVSDYMNHMEILTITNDEPPQKLTNNLKVLIAMLKKEDTSNLDFIDKQYKLQNRASNSVSMNVLHNIWTLSGISSTNSWDSYSTESLSQIDFVSESVAQTEVDQTIEEMEIDEDIDDLFGDTTNEDMKENTNNTNTNSNAHNTNNDKETQYEYTADLFATNASQAIEYFKSVDKFCKAMQLNHTILPDEPTNESEVDEPSNELEVDEPSNDQADEGQQQDEDDEIEDEQANEQYEDSAFYDMSFRKDRYCFTFKPVSVWGYGDRKPDYITLNALYPHWQQNKYNGKTYIIIPQSECAACMTWSFILKIENGESSKIVAVPWWFPIPLIEHATKYTNVFARFVKCLTELIQNVHII